MKKLQTLAEAEAVAEAVAAVDTVAKAKVVAEAETAAEERAVGVPVMMTETAATGIVAEGGVPTSDAAEGGVPSSEAAAKGGVPTSNAAEGGVPTSDAAAAVSRPLQWYIMTSPFTHRDTLSHFEEHDYFGLLRDQVHFFQQGFLPCLTEEGAWKV